MPAPRPTVVTVIALARHRLHEIADAVLRRLAVGEQDDVLLPRARDGERLVRRVERAEDLRAAPGLDARDVVLDARAVLGRRHLARCAWAASRRR